MQTSYPFYLYLERREEEIKGVGGGTVKTGRRGGERGGGRKGGREEGREGGREGGRKGGREGGRKGGREGGREGKREWRVPSFLARCLKPILR